MRTSTAGLGLALLSAATFGTSGTFATSLIATGWTPGAAVLARVTIAALVLTGPALLQLRGRWTLLRANLPVVLAFGGFAVGVAQLFFFSAVEHLSVGVALLLEYSGVLLVVGWMWLRHGQRPGRLTVVGGVAAIGGLALVLDLTGSQRIDVVGVLWGLAAAVGLAAYFVISARTGDSLPPIVTAWSGLVVGAVTLAVLGAVRLLPMHASTADVDLGGWQVSWVVPIIGLSVVAAAVAYAAGIGAARRLGARLASFVGLSEVLFAVLFAWLLLDQQPTVLQAVGGVVVLVGIALVRAAERAPAPDATAVPEPAGTLG
ncbi:MAG TPA: DMT family transporter [Jatrophihabitans sp.]|nr:DMT family transporter [Jatrophihabitans sp.]